LIEIRVIFVTSLFILYSFTIIGN